MRASAFLLLVLFSVSCSASREGGDATKAGSLLENYETVQLTPDLSTADAKARQDARLFEASGDILKVMTEARVTNLAQSIRVYNQQHGKPPRSLHDLWECAPHVKEKCRPTIDKVTSLEPWGNGYFYFVDQAGATIVMGSFGRDGKAGGEGFDRDTVVLLSTKEDS